MADPIPHTQKPLSESQAIIERRKKAGVEPGQPLVGLALSGGGIRSATFSLGFIRRLAKNQLLHRVDYLSTVSGGGYTGGMLGRLYREQNKPDDVEKSLAKNDTLLLWWLRNNGRYLTPAGMSDLALSVAQIIRSFLFTFFLITLLSTLVCGLAVSLNLFYGEELAGFSRAFIVPLFLAGWLCCSYWLFKNRVVWLVATVVVIGAFAVGANIYYRQETHSLLPLALPFILFLAGVIPALFQASQSGKNLASFRLYLTRTLTNFLWVILALGFLWLVNRAGYYLYTYLDNKDSLFYLIPSVLLLVKLAGELRPLQWLGKKLFSLAQKKKANPLTLINLAGFLLAFLILIAGCAGLFHSNELLLKARPSINEGVLVFFEILIPIVVLISWRCLPEYLNLSSLHNLYRARIERAWVSVANFRRKGHENARFPANPLQPYNRDTTDGIVKVTTALPDDDISFADYNPALFGGPLHLITSCINQTIDDRTGNYSADRKGIALTLSAFGVETGTQFPQSSDSHQSEMLSSWLAISGAAASTGMGSLTSPGLAFLLFFFGARLGYWSENLLPSAEVIPGMPAQKTSLWDRFSTVFAPAGFLFGEMFARFPGLGSQKWFLSDGGHFENTAVYPLLKRRVPIIVVTDCGADPKYKFEDMENLVRKAQIDYQTEITFYDFSASPLISFGNQNQMQPCTASPPLLMARIEYPDDLPGVLIVAKPHWLENMPLDTASYADRNADFPQQSTADQFFDEAQ